MNPDTIAPSQVRPATGSRTKAKFGAGLTGLVALFLAIDGITKVIRLAPVIEACGKMGISPAVAAGIGFLLLACTIVYLIPRTAVLGAVLITGFLGGATATHVIHGSGVFATAFAIAFGVLAWAGLVLREPRLIRIMFRRS